MRATSKRMPEPLTNDRAIKICGVTTAEALDAAITARADYVGFNFFPPSPRFLALNEAPALRERAANRITKVGVFVDPSEELIADTMAAAGLDILQLHGQESPELTARLRRVFGVPVWKVIPVAKADDVARSEAYRGAADLVLFDAKTPDGALPGGMGLAFDWSWLRGRTSFPAWGVAGGLTPENVSSAIHATGAGLVDTSSGVESAPGVKSVEKILDFCRAARA